MTRPGTNARASWVGLAVSDIKVADRSGEDDAITEGAIAHASIEEGAVAIDRLAGEFGVTISAPVRDALVAYGRLLLSWGERINLTAARSMRALISEHFPDAFALARQFAAEVGSHPNVVDVGSGGGLPALPLALLRPDASLVLFEATGKKVAFLRTAVRALGLGDRVQVRHARLEEKVRVGNRRAPARREPEANDVGETLFDVAISRATLPPQDWLALAWTLVRPGVGRVFCLSSHEVVEWPVQLTLATQRKYRGDRWIAALIRST
jgi:16S rRNA (guanine(527)-N(7))-methyltransferase RsmG